MKRFNISHEYDYNLYCKGVYSAKTPLIAQICSFLNPLRQKAEQALEMKSELKLSSAYVLYFYLLSQAESIADFTLKNGDEKEAISFAGGQLSRLFTFEDFACIVKENGIVPMPSMPDPAHHHKSDCVYILENRIRLGVSQLVKGEITKERLLSEARAILSEGLGEPPEGFSLTYIDSEDSLKTLDGLTPVEFFRNYCSTDLDNYCVISTSDSKAKAAVAAQIKGGEQVVVLADTRHQVNKMLGILDTDFQDNTDVFGFDFSVSKADKLRLGIIRAESYLSLDGVAFDENGSPLRFKAQDTDGSETGADGHYTMSAKWFDEYVISAIVNKKYLD